MRAFDQAKLGPRDIDLTACSLQKGELSARSAIDPRPPGAQTDHFQM